MPPPKKPKNGPTSVEQFLSNEELQVIGRNKRAIRKEGNNASRTNRSVLTRTGTVAEASFGEYSAKTALIFNRSQNELANSDGTARRFLSNLPDNYPAYSRNQENLKERSRSPTPVIDPPKDPPQLVRVQFATPPSQVYPSTGCTHSPKGANTGTLLQRLFTEPPIEKFVLGNGSCSRGHSSSPGNSNPYPLKDTFSSVDLLGMDYKLATSSTLASLITTPPWLPSGSPRHLTSSSQSSVTLDHRSDNEVDMQEITPPTSLTIGHQPQQQHRLDRRSILASFFSNNMNSVPKDSTSLKSKHLLPLKSSPIRAGNSSSFYLSNLMRQTPAQSLRTVSVGSSSGAITSPQGTELAPVYLHPAFHLPLPSTSSNTKTNSTSLSLISSPPLGDSCLPRLPRNSNAMKTPPRTSPLKQCHATYNISSLASTGSSIKNSYVAANNSKNNSFIPTVNSFIPTGNNKDSVISTGNSKDSSDNLLDLSLKNKQFPEEPSYAQINNSTSIPRKASILAALMEKSLSQGDGMSASVMDYSFRDSEDSVGCMNLTNLESATTLSPSVSGSYACLSKLIEKPQAISSVNLVGLLTASPVTMIPVSSCMLVKEEADNSVRPYDLVACKTERHRSGFDTDSREPSDCKSPKEEERMVSPGSCIQVLPLGGSGESSGGSAHLQAPTSTTPEAGSGSHPHNFLLDAHGAGIGASPPSQMKQEIGGAMPGSSMQARLCQVCNDNASGFHYGVWSCEGCKAFFKRSIQGPVDYICPATNTCTIDKHRRKSCQACRLRRCYEVGMNKGSQRKERKSSGPSSGLKGRRYRPDSSDSTINSTNNGASSSKAAKRSRSASILEALQKADLPVLESYHNHSLPATRVHLLNTLIKLADRELVYLINWAKHVPGYTALTLSDQVHLIECCWMELLLLNCAFRSMEYEGRTLVFAPDFHLERQQWGLTGMGEVLEQVSAVSEQMVLHGLNKEELLLLQATVLVNAEVRRLDSCVKIQEMRQVILDVFMEVAGRHQGYGNLRHAPSILLLLTHIRQAGERGITYFQRLKMEGCVTFCDLLTEMLDAHNSSCERRRLQQQQQHHHQQHPSQTPHQQQHLSQLQPGHHQHQQQQQQQQQQHPPHSMAPE